MKLFHEIGIGYVHKFLCKRLTVGTRIKRVTGMFHASIQERAIGTLATDATDFVWTVNLENASANTAGLDYLFNSDNYNVKDFTKYLVNNENSTIAFDIGVKFKVLVAGAEAAINDIGSINWKEQTRNYNLYDTTVIFRGVELEGIENSNQVLEDSLTNKFRSDETRLAFSSNLPTRVFLTASAYLTPNDKILINLFSEECIGKNAGQLCLII